MRVSSWLLALTAVCGLAAPLQAAEIAISCGAVGQQRELCEQAAKAWAQESGHSVTVTSPPDDTDARYYKYLVELGGGDSSVDVFQIDVIWPGLLAKHFIDLKAHVPEAEIRQHLPAIIENNTVEGRLVGLPWYTDVGLLFYRKDLLERHGAAVPERWSELADQALWIQQAERGAGRESLWGFVFQGAAYEGLTTNALEWIGSHNGGTIIDRDGRITVNNAWAALAVARAAAWVGTLAPPRVTGFNEEDARITFQRGEAVFMRNWPYAWALLNAGDSPVAGKVGIAPLPKGGPEGRHRSTLGGWQLAVSKYSRHPEVAADLVRYLTGAAVQKERAIAGSYAPTILSLYEDPEVLAANPFFAELPPILAEAILRPAEATGGSYMAVTTRFWEAVHAALTGKAPAVEALAELEAELRRIQFRSGGW